MRLEPLVICSLACACGGATKKPAPAWDSPEVTIPWQTSGIDWSRAPAPGPEPEFHPPAPVTFELANGMKVVAIANRRLPLVSIQLVNPLAGGVHDPADLKGLAALTADMLDESAGRWSALALAGETERLGADLSTSAGVEAAYVEMDTLATTLEPSLGLLAAVIASPSFTEADFDRVKGDRLSMIKRRRDRPASVASLLFDRLIFGGHAYALPNSGTTEAVARITREDVVQFFGNHYTPERVTAIIVGDVDPEALREVLGATLGSWQPRPIAPTEPNLLLPRSRQPRLVVCDKPGAKQSAVRLGRIGLRRSDPRYFDAVVLNTVLGGSFTSRLNNRLREQLGYTYGVRSTFWFGRESGTWRVHTSMKTESTIDGIREALQMIARLRSEDIPAEELLRNRQNLVRQFPQDFESNAAVADSFAELVVHDLPLSWYGTYRAGIGTASATRARELAAGAWTEARLVVVVVGDLKKILTGLLGLGFGDALEVDAEGNPIRSHHVP